MDDLAGRVAVVTGAAGGIGRALYVLGEDDWRRCCEVRFEDIRVGRNPTFTIAEALG